MKRALALAAATVTSATAAYADIPIIDKANYAVAKDTAEKTARILDTNKGILKTVETTLQAITGERSHIAASLTDLAIGNGFSVTSMPSFDQLLQSGMPNFGSMGPEVARSATLFINGLQLVKSLSGKNDSGLAGDKSYEELMKTVLGVSALVTGSQQAAEVRRTALERAGRVVGTSTDIKGSIDQNTQLQVQTGLTLNEMIGILGGAVRSLQAENQRKLTDISNTKKALTYE